SSATIVLDSSTLAGNQAGDAVGDNGGGLLINNAGGSVRVVNSTIASNTTAGAGGGIFDHHTGGSLAVLNRTVGSNSAAVSGGGFQVDSGATLTQLESTIVASNASGTIGPDIVNAGNLVAANNNLIQNGFSGTPPSLQTDNLVGMDPLLGPLQDNG